MRKFIFVSLAFMITVLMTSCADEKKPAKQQHSPASLAIGQVAPEISGEDIDGVPFQLSDYRGKVVVLDFWGNW